MIYLFDEDDELAGKSAEWVAGYMVARKKRRPRQQYSAGAMAVALAASTALDYARSRKK